MFIYLLYRNLLKRSKGGKMDTLHIKYTRETVILYCIHLLVRHIKMKIRLSTHLFGTGTRTKEYSMVTLMLQLEKLKWSHSPESRSQHFLHLIYRKNFTEVKKNLNLTKLNFDLEQFE